ncbi:MULTISPECIES: prepilin peptidase [unclassified Frigoribacterium]|uniref:prepilin peptidase n=1 Tax=unclassified Frigoribacterium TaxID=2627005 RepID=UPI0006F1F977|nr:MULTISPECIES: A24 family peptidase [unclassified Frigoribacterium]KQM29390.1 peptidase A24 [Frigoribacterium sp. Leaf8]WAC52362.1 prepilin peptidase [Frigoribacterium sp. SL97]
MIALVFPLSLTAALGLAIGSFLNVVVYRVPAGLSVARPASACPGCGTPIRRRDNVPVVSWLALGGKCRDCRTSISARYPIVELATGLFFVLVAARLWPLVGVPTEALPLVARLLSLVAFLWLAGVSVALAVIDLEHHRLPDAIVLPSYAVGGVLLAASSILVGDWPALVRAAIGLASLFAFYLIAALSYPGGMGFGDVKLAGVLGLYLAWLGWGEFAVGAFAAFLLGGLFAVVLLVTRRVERTGGIPFGPWMLAGAWVGVFAGGTVATAYLTLLGLA